MEKAIEEAEIKFQSLSTSENVELLNPVDELQDVFKSSAPPRKRIHILVLVPGGESIDPRMWRRC